MKTNLLKTSRAVLFFATLSLALHPALKAGWQRSTLADDLSTEDMRELAQVASELVPGQTLSQPTGATQTQEAGDELKSLQGQPVETFQAPPDNVAGIQQIMAASMGLEPSAMGGIAPAAASVAPETLPEIKAIANALGNNADRILNWVVTNIEYEPYNGLKRGARRTAIERAGNSFDTAALTVALLRAAIPGVQASYCLTYRGMSRSDASIWLGVASDQIERYLKDAGADYPGIAWVQWDSANVYFPHVLVKLIINGVPYYYDPSYKTYTYGNGVNLSAKASYTFTTFNNNIAAAGSASVGGQTVSTFVGSTAVKPSVRNQLNTCATNLINNILNSDTDHDIDGREAAGARWINPNSPAVYTLTPGGGIEWPEIPDYLCVKMSVTVGGITRTYNTADWGGKKISITFANKQATLYVDDIQDGSSETGATAATAPVSITFSYPNGISYTETPAPLDRSGGTYVITYGFDHCLGMVKERMRKLAQLKEQNYAATSRELISENLYLIGLQYLNENNVINEIASGVTSVRMSVQHQAGIVGTSQAPFVDLPANVAAMGIRTSGIASGVPYDNTNPLKAIPTTDAMRTLLDKATLADINWTSMLEHSVIEQMIVTDANPSNQYLNSAVSTTKMIQ